MDIDAIQLNYEQYIEKKKRYAHFGYDIDAERRFILDAAQPVAGRILEAGTGKGYFALTLAQAGYSFVTFDISADEQHFARLNLAYSGVEGQVDFRIENAERTSFADASFDVIFSVNVLHHLRNPYPVLDEFIRLLSPTGKMVIADFTEEGFRLVDAIHRLDGAIHEVGPTGLMDAQQHLQRKGFFVLPSQSQYQSVLVGVKGAVPA